MTPANTRLAALRTSRFFMGDSITKRLLNVVYDILALHDHLPLPPLRVAIQRLIRIEGDRCLDEFQHRNVALRVSDANRLLERQIFFAYCSLEYGRLIADKFLVLHFPREIAGGARREEIPVDLVKSRLIAEPIGDEFR